MRPRPAGGSFSIPVSLRDQAALAVGDSQAYKLAGTQSLQVNNLGAASVVAGYLCRPGIVLAL